MLRSAVRPPVPGLRLVFNSAPLPPTLIIVGENDILRDEGEAYARKLIQAGVEVTAVRLLATVHDFAMLNGLAETPASRLAIQLASQKLAAALGLENARGSSTSR